MTHSIKQQARLISASVADLAARPARETIDWDCLRRVAEYREHCEWIQAKRAEVRRLYIESGAFGRELGNAMINFGQTIREMPLNIYRPIFDDAEGRN